MPSSGVQTCARSEEHTSELQSLTNLVCRLLLEKKKVPGVTMNEEPNVYSVKTVDQLSSFRLLVEPIWTPSKKIAPFLNCPTFEAAVDPPLLLVKLYFMLSTFIFSPVALTSNLAKLTPEAPLTTSPVAESVAFVKVRTPAAIVCVPALEAVKVVLL